MEAICRIETYTHSITLEELRNNQLIQDGVVRNLEIIGEAAKKLPDDVKSKASDIDWRKIAGMRDLLIHQYFGIDVEIIWDVVEQKLPELRDAVNKLLSGSQ